MTAETIFALASGAGRAGIAIIRISGPGAGPALAAITGAKAGTGGEAGGSPEPRRATIVKLSDPETLVAIDDGLALWFPAPDSFTGEDVAELHVHGGPAVVMGTLEALGAMPGLRTAEPGEFTRRAFENGKMDLTAAEGLADLVEAETSAQRRQALRQLRGELGKLYESWRERLLNALAHIEAGIDFSDQDLPGGPGGVEAAAAEEVGKLVGEIAAHLKDNRRGERLRSGLLITIIGPPNAGKSSLLNLLAQRDAAIVHETAGTTRDVIEVHLDLGGYPVIVADTAGLRDIGDGGNGGPGVIDVEAEGIRRARGKAREADLRLAVFDGQAWPETDSHTAGLVDADTLVVINKSDLGRLAPPLIVGGQPGLAISALTGDGIETFLAVAAERVAGLMETTASSTIGPALTRARHREALEECRAALERFLAVTDGDKWSDKTPELAAEDLRLAARALGRITGRVDVEDVLDAIFRDFCIGK
ncbi:MAG: tRNA uridine-5-carboxymethylaminomethyl(34) synthesis GTPase MnmE [Proteobacteria bacterium]|nr:tRNA uridine-5-carboxymethylaminomethyl(34) synthesis GTPase MnmE [Pseudomonadota bacterium]